MSCSILLWLWKNLWISLLKFVWGKNLFNETVWVTKQPPLLIIAFLTRGVFGSWWGRDMSRLLMITSLGRTQPKAAAWQLWCFPCWHQALNSKCRTAEQSRETWASEWITAAWAVRLEPQHFNPFRSHCSVKAAWKGLGQSTGRHIDAEYLLSGLWDGSDALLRITRSLFAVCLSPDWSCDSKSGFVELLCP